MEYNFQPSDFEGDNFMSTSDCALARLYKREVRKELPEGWSIDVGTSILGVRSLKTRHTTEHTASTVKLNGEVISKEYEFGFEARHYRIIKEAIKDGTFESATIEINPV